MNCVLLIGRIAGKLELKEINNDKKVLNLTIAVKRDYKNQNGEYESDFINTQVWNKQAENLIKYCKKGDLISLEGRIKTESYQNNEGKKVYNTYILCEKVRFLQTKKEKNDNLPKKEENVRNNEIEVNPFEEFANEIEINENDLPF